MVYTKKKYTPRRKPYKKRTFKKRYVKYKRGVPSGMPNIRIAKLRYSSQEQLTSSGALVGNIWRANSINDPQEAIGGHQPMGHDTWATLFHHYVVLGSKITVNFVSSATTGAAPGTAGIYLSPTANFAYSNSSAFIEAKRGPYKQMSANSTRQVVMRNTFSAKKFFNVKDVKDNLLRLGAATNVDPTEGAFFLIWFQTASGTTTWYFTITIDYIVLYSEPRTMVQS